MQLLTSGAHNPKVKEAGTKPIITAIKRVKASAINSFALAMVPLAQKILVSAQARVSQPFQTQPSYILWSQFYPGQGYKVYPPETRGFFSTKSPSVQGTPWKGLVQVRRRPYDDAGKSGNIRNKLTTSAYTSSSGIYKNAKVTVEVGYPEDVQLYKDPYKEISWVLLGTKLMQPRNFLWVVLSEYQADFRKDVTRQLLQSFEYFGRRFQASDVQLEEWIDRDFVAINEIIRLGQNFGAPGTTSPGERNRFTRNHRLSRGDRKEIARRRRRLNRNLGDLVERGRFGKKFDGNVDKFINSRLKDLFSGRISRNPRRFVTPHRKRRRG